MIILIMKILLMSFEQLGISFIYFSWGVQFQQVGRQNNQSTQKIYYCVPENSIETNLENMWHSTPRTSIYIPFYVHSTRSKYVLENMYCRGHLFGLNIRRWTMSGHQDWHDFLIGSFKFQCRIQISNFSAGSKWRIVH